MRTRIIFQDGSGSIIFSRDPEPDQDPDLNQAHFTLPPILPSFHITLLSSLTSSPLSLTRTPHLSSLIPHQSTLTSTLSPRSVDDTTELDSAVSMTPWICLSLRIYNRNLNYKRIKKIFSAFE